MLQIERIYDYIQTYSCDFIEACMIVEFSYSLMQFLLERFLFIFS